VVETIHVIRQWVADTVVVEVQVIRKAKKALAQVVDTVEYFIKTYHLVMHVSSQVVAEVVLVLAPLAAMPITVTRPVLVDQAAGQVVKVQQATIHLPTVDHSPVVEQTMPVAPHRDKAVANYLVEQAVHT
jgi:hypothetical protein